MCAQTSPPLLISSITLSLASSPKRCQMPHGKAENAPRDEEDRCGTRMIPTISRHCSLAALPSRLRPGLASATGLQKSPLGQQRLQPLVWWLSQNLLKMESPFCRTTCDSSTSADKQGLVLHSPFGSERLPRVDLIHFYCAVLLCEGAIAGTVGNMQMGIIFSLSFPPA